ncbi:NAD(+)--rifampin ADP-ribosyltransferase [Brachybacterium aquaticum]|uniref:Rifampin ADP-ribosylating transferase n=1 Tax=Brachybacterium aquaticum TaxID=1432564 RepID=A0A841A7A6_9MICO|nr:NAD(+)--rifampin ADP-ribosyltransferase [Brachybacterium aquaticum]MBB5830736.1 rifampin ADP-ribosylating transferase [Brachybacterium aquaticum]
METNDAPQHPAYFHGTRAALQPGDLIAAGHRSNYRPEVVMNHVYFTARCDGGVLAAEIAAMLGPEGSAPHVYLVEPTGPFEDDPNVTDKKFPGNPTQSYRSTAPLRILEEITDWTRLEPAELDLWRERLAAMRENDAEIIN